MASAVRIPIIIANYVKWASAIADGAPALMLPRMDAHVPL
jgi:hypothetical protein